jgi:hypothetical protein
MPYTHLLFGSPKGLPAFLEVSVTLRAHAMKLDYPHVELKVRSFRNHSVIFPGWPFAN